MSYRKTSWMQIFFFLIMFLISALVVMDSLSARFTTTQKLMQAGYYALISTSIFFNRALIYRAGGVYFKILCFLVFLWLLAGLYNSGYIVWVIGDFLIISSALAYVSFFTSRSYSLGHFGLPWVIGLLSVSALMAPFFFDPTDRGRFQPPHYLLISYCAIRMVSQRRIIGFVYYFVAVVGVAFLAFESQWRFSFIAVLIAVTLAIWVAEFKLKYLLLSGAAFFLAIVVTFYDGSTLFSIANFSDTRFASIFRGGVSGDDSLMFRYYEVHTVWSHILQTWSLLQYLLGEGHGASFPSSGLLGMATEQFVSRNVVDGHVHNIHLGLMLVFFRYGLIGLMFILWLFFDCLKCLSQCSIRRSPTETLSAMTLSLYLIATLLLYNETNDILFGYCVGLYFASKSNRMRSNESFVGSHLSLNGYTRGSSN